MAFEAVLMGSGMLQEEQFIPEKMSACVTQSI